VKVFDERTARAVSTILLLVIAGAFVYGARHVLITLLFAIVFAYVLDPWVSRMEQWQKLSRASRTTATLEVYAILILAIAISLLLFGPSIANEGRTFAAKLPSLFEKVSSGEIARDIGATHGWSYRSQLQMETFIKEHSGELLSWMGSFTTQIAEIVGNLFWIALVPILAFFLLKDGRKFVDYALEMVESASRREFLASILRDLNQMMAQYIRVQLILAGLALIFYMSALSLLRVPYALILGSVAGLLEFLPTIGPALSAIAILSVAFLAGYSHLFIVMLFLAVWRITQDYVIFPRITKTEMKLHPLAAILAILVGAEIGGVAGAYLSIPIMASAGILRKRWEGPREPQEEAVQ
jgi:predicted PurR-regulated permease PerM